MHTAHHSVIILDDHPLVARGLAEYFQSIRPDLIVHVATRWEEFLNLILTHGQPGMVVTDIWLSSGNVLDGVEQFRQRCPHTPWLAISGDDDPSVAQRMRAAGAQGFVHKRAPPETFAQAFEALLSGVQWFESFSTLEPQSGSGYAAPQWTVTPAELGLTRRQGEILALVLRGLPNKRIALSLGVSESTVKEHVTGILEKLGVHSRVEAITLLRGRRMALPEPT